VIDKEKTLADDNRLTAQVRTEFGKGAARRTRAAGKIPAVLYGHGTVPQHLILPGHEVTLIVRKANAVLDLDIEGTSQLALVKDVQKDPVRQAIEHLDLIVVRRGEKVTVDIPVHLEGEPFSGTIAILENTTLSIEAEATHIPERIVVDVEGLEDGAQILAGDVVLPAGASLITDPETLVVLVSTPRGASAEEEAADAAMAAAASEASAAAAAAAELSGD